MTAGGISEERIVWSHDGLAYRVRVLETRLSPAVAGVSTGGGCGRVPGVPGRPTDLEVTAQQVVQDHLGQTLIAVTITWDGEANLWEVVWGEAV